MTTSTAIFLHLISACTPLTPLPPDPTPPQDSPTDTAPADSGGDTAIPPSSLPYAGSFWVEIDAERCEGLADAIVIGSTNIAGNADCQWPDGMMLSLTLSGRIDARKPQVASGSVASPEWLLSWQGTWTPETLSGTFSTQKPALISGAFSLHAER